MIRSANVRRAHQRHLQRRKAHSRTIRSRGRRGTAPCFGEHAAMHATSRGPLPSQWGCCCCRPPLSTWVRCYRNQHEKRVVGNNVADSFRFRARMRKAISNRLTRSAHTVYTFCFSNLRYFPYKPLLSMCL